MVLCELAFGLGGVHAVTGDGSELLAAVVLIVNVVGDVFQILHVGPANVETLVRLGRYVVVKSRDEENEKRRDQPEAAQLLREFVKKCIYLFIFFNYSDKLRQTVGVYSDGFIHCN